MNQMLKQAQKMQDEITALQADLEQREFTGTAGGGVVEVMIIGHTDCGAKHMNSSEMIEKMKERGIPQERIDMIRYCGINFESWLRGFETSEASVHETVEQIRNHPLIPSDITVRGFVIDSVTGELTPVE